MERFNKKFDQKYLKVCRYAAITVIITFAVCFWIYAMRFSFINVWTITKAVLRPIVWGAVICYVLYPAVRWLDGFLKSHHIIKKDSLRRILSVIIMFLLIFGVIAFIVSFILLLITRSVSKVNLESLMAVYQQLSGEFNSFFDMFGDAISKFGLSFSEGASTFTFIGDTFTMIASAVTTIVFALIFCIYFMFDHQEVEGYLSRLARAIFGEEALAKYAFFVEDADRAFSGYIRGQFLDALLVGSCTMLVFAILNIPYWPVIGLLTGIANLIPYLGGPMGFGCTIIACLLEGNYIKLVIGCIVLAIIMFVDGNVVNPRLLAQTVEVHPLLVIVALVAGGAIGGLAGMLIAVPTAALIKTELDRWIDKREAIMGIEVENSVLESDKKGA